MTEKGSNMSAVRSNDKVREIMSRIERLPLTRWQAKALVFVGAANFFDAFDALTIAFALTSTCWCLVYKTPVYRDSDSCGFPRPTVWRHSFWKGGGPLRKTSHDSGNYSRV